MRSQVRKWVSLLCVLALMAGLVVVPAGAAMPMMEGGVEEIPAESAAGTGTMPAHTHAHAETPALDPSQDAAAEVLADANNIHNFQTQGVTPNGIYSNFGGAIKKSGYGLPVNDWTAPDGETVLSFAQGMQIDSSADITFKAPADGDMFMLFSQVDKVMLDGTLTNISTKEYRWEVSQGEHHIKKASGGNTVIVYMEFLDRCPGHAYDDEHVKVKTPASCDEDGVGVKVCIHCGAEGETYVIEAKGHGVGVPFDEDPPTCSTSGTAAGTVCPDCGEVLTGGETLEATGKHVDDNHDLECDVCGADMPEPHDEHIFNETTREPDRDTATCGKAGVKIWYCTYTNCGVTHEEVSPAKEHSWETKNAQKPTCTAVGWDEYQYCTRCGQKQGYVEKKALGHDFDDNGNCTRCDATMDTAGMVSGGWFEALYAEIEGVSDAQVAQVAYAGPLSGELLDEDLEFLVRDATLAGGKTGVRIDIPGLPAGTYSMTVTTTDSRRYTASNIKVQAHDRSGYAHWNYTEGVGAYRDDGIVKDNAIILYVTEENKNTVELSYGGITVRGIGNILNSVGQESSEKPGYCKRTSGKSTYWGIANSNQNILKKLADADIPLVVRIVGTVSSAHPAPADGWIEGLTAYNTWDYGGSEKDQGNMARMRDCKNITIEGIGADAVVNGWGFHFMASTSTPNLGKNFEVRNIEFRNVPEDCVGMEGVQSGSTITAPILHGWVHNCSFYIPDPLISPKAESDKGEGDGACDFKRGEFFTMSYCYFEGCHKTNLVGSSDDSLQFNITWHHNYWVNCKARGPLARNANMHIYNCIFEGQRDYAMNTRANAYIYSEYNALINCKYPMKVESGAIKSYNDAITSCIQLDKMGKIVESRDEVVDSANKYASFELDSSKGYIKDLNYNLDTSVSTARQNIMAYTGPMKPADEVVTADELPAETLPEGYTPSGYVPLDYDKDMNTSNAQQTGENSDHIVFHLSKLDGTRATFGKDSIGRHIVFETDKVTNITMTPEGSSLISLYNADGKLVAENGNTATNCPPGVYYIQPSTIQPGDAKTPATFKEGKLLHLKIEEVKNPDPIYEHTTHTYTVDGGTLVEPTCTMEGKQKMICSGCAEYIIVPVAKVDHIYAGGECVDCGLSESLGYDPDAAGTEPPTPSDPVPVTGVSLNKTELTVNVDKTERLTATIAPSNATNKKVTWTSSDESVATVQNGAVTGVSFGTATITVKTEDGGFTATCEVSVVDIQEKDFTFTATKEPAQPKDENPAAEGSKWGDEDFLTVTGAGVVWRTQNKTTNLATASIQVGQQEGNGLSFTVAPNSTATVTIEFSSTGKANISALALVKGTTLGGDAERVSVTSTTGDKGVKGDLVYMTGTDSKTVTFENLTPGTYTIVAPKVVPSDMGLTDFKANDTTSSSNPYDPNARGARIFTINMHQRTVNGGAAPKEGTLGDEGSEVNWTLTSGGTLTFENTQNRIADTDNIFVAIWGANNVFQGARIVKASQLSAEVGKGWDHLKLIWADSKFAPKCEAETVTK